MVTGSMEASKKVVSSAHANSVLDHPGLETAIVVGAVVSRENQPSGPVTATVSAIVTKARGTGSPPWSMTRPDTLTTGIVVVVGAVVVDVVGAVVVDVLDGEVAGRVVVELSVTAVVSPVHDVSRTAATNTMWCLLTSRSYGSVET
jgi:hypothetical protein